MTRTEREFIRLQRRKKARMLAALKALRQRVRDAGLDNEPMWTHTLGEMMGTLIAYPETMSDPVALQAQIALSTVAQFWAPDQLAHRREEFRVGGLYLELRKAA